MIGILNKKMFLIVGSILLLILLLLRILFKSGTKSDGQIIISPTPVVSLSPSSFLNPTLKSPLISETPPDSTGYGEPSISVGENNSINQTTALRRKLPYSQNEFSLIYDYDQLKFIVTINTPFEQNKALFKQFLKSQGYGDIKEEKFLYKTK